MTGDNLPVRLIVDKRNDERLTEILTSAVSICAVVPNIDVRAYLVSQVVASSTGGGFLFSEDQIRGVYYGSLDCITALNKSSIFVGELIKGKNYKESLYSKLINPETSSLERFPRYFV